MPLTKIQSLGITDGTIVNADINASAGIVGTKLSGVNDAKAWVNFNGSGTVAIRASFNVTSITDNATGDYTINFTNALSDTNYCMVSAPSHTNNSDQATFSVRSYDTTISTTSINIITAYSNANANSILDMATIGVAIFR